MANKYNPLQTIIIFEATLKIEEPFMKEFKNFIMEYIGVINRHNTNEEINNYIHAHPFEGHDTRASDTEIKAEITKVIPKLKKICDTKNMMDHFMDTLYLIEKK